MDNFALRSSMVTQQSSKTSLSSRVDFRQLMTESGGRVANYLTSINLDKRNVAVAGLNSYWAYELIREMEPEWAAVIECEHIAQEQIMFTHKPQSVLFINADMMIIPVYKDKFPDSNICFMNNASLFFLESVMGNMEHVGYRSEDAYEYDVIDKEDLGTEKFDMIVSWAWSIIGDDSLLVNLVSSLNDNGVLLINNSNHNSKLYREDFHIHPYSRMHELLQSQQGKTYHLANGYGQTVFVKGL